MFNQSCQFIGYRGIGVEIVQAADGCHHPGPSAPPAHSPNQNHLLAALRTRRSNVWPSTSSPSRCAR
jgi:hypothetical protein